MRERTKFLFVVLSVSFSALVIDFVFVVIFFHCARSLCTDVCLSSLCLCLCLCVRLCVCVCVVVLLLRLGTAFAFVVLIFLIYCKRCRSNGILLFICQ